MLPAATEVCRLAWAASCCRVQLGDLSLAQRYTPALLVPLVATARTRHLRGSPTGLRSRMMTAARDSDRVGRCNGGIAFDILEA